MVKEGFVLITPDITHDAHAVANFGKKVVEHLAEQGVEVDRIHEWTGGAASQYKVKMSFTDISLLPTDHSMISVVQNFLQISHGKSPCDGLGGTVKRMASQAVLQKKVIIRDAKELFNYCTKHLTCVGQSTYPSCVDQYQHSRRAFVYVDSGDILNLV